jgi:hypothetical protein
MTTPFIKKYINLEVVALIIIIYGIVISYGSALLVYLYEDRWPTIGNPKSYESYLFRDDMHLWYSISGESLAISLFSALTFYYTLLKLLYLFYRYFTKKSTKISYITIALLVFSTFDILDPFGVGNWLVD